MRLFIGIKLSETVTSRVADAMARMRPLAETAQLNVAWVKPANLHITLRFLGSSDPAIVPRLSEELARACTGSTAFDLAVCGVGAFPRENAARVLWVGTNEPRGVLTTLQSDLEKVAVTCGFPPEPRPFSPHLTVGRVKSGRNSGPVLTPFKDLDFGTSRIEEVVLFQSATLSTGPEYQTVDTYKLS